VLLTGLARYNGSQALSSVYKNFTLSLASFAASVMRESKSLHVCNEIEEQKRVKDQSDSEKCIFNTSLQHGEDKKDGKGSKTNNN